MKYGDSFEVTDKNAFFKEQQEIASDLLGKLEQQEYLCIRYNGIRYYHKIFNNAD